MTVDVRGTHGYSPSDATQEYVDKKLMRFDHVKDHVADLHIVLDKENSGEYKAEATIHFRWGTMGHLKVTNRNLYKAIDQMLDKTMTKVTREKEKIQDH